MPKTLIFGILIRLTLKIILQITPDNRFIRETFCLFTESKSKFAACKPECNIILIEEYRKRTVKVDENSPLLNIKLLTNGAVKITAIPAKPAVTITPQNTFSPFLFKEIFGKKPSVKQCKRLTGKENTASTPPV